MITQGANSKPKVMCDLCDWDSREFPDRERAEFIETAHLINQHNGAAAFPDHEIVTGKFKRLPKPETKPDPDHPQSKSNIEKFCDGITDLFQKFKGEPHG